MRGPQDDLLTVEGPRAGGPVSDDDSEDSEDSEGAMSATVRVRVLVLFLPSRDRRPQRGVRLAARTRRLQSSCKGGWVDRVHGWLMGGST